VRQHRPTICGQACPWPEQGAADIIGLYLNPPENALVLSVDEKPTIQALERASGYVLTSSGKIVHGLKSTYKRHGTVNLFAALEVATGVIRGKTTQTKKRVDFQAFMTDLIAEQPPDREIHVILDNLSTHKKNDDWLAAHPNVTFHFTPTSASWLNQVEIWFGIFSRKPWPEPALPASRNWSRQSATSPKPTTATPRPSSGASARSRVPNCVILSSTYAIRH
jgi:DDE superfamily endonuclease